MSLALPINTKSQRDRRHHQNVYTSAWEDQWGRTFYGQAHKDSGHPIGALNLAPEYRVPYRYLIPGNEYMRFGAPHSRRFDILLDQWQIENARAWSDYRKAMVQFAEMRYKEAADDRLQEMAPVIREKVGPPPMAPEFLAAMRDGNSWVLGKRLKSGLWPAQPAWVTPVMLDTLRIYETFEGSGEIPTFTAGSFADDEDGDGVAVSLPTDDERSSPAGEGVPTLPDLGAAVTTGRNASGQFKKRDA